MDTATKFYHMHTCNVYMIPEEIGAYVITHTQDYVHAERYVGSTKNLRERKTGHYNKGILYVDLYITDDIELALSLERILIHLIKPATNIIIPSLTDKDNELMNELLKDNRIRTLLSDNIIKFGCRYLKYIDSDNKESNYKKHVEEDLHIESIKKYTNIRIAQQKNNNSITVTLPIDETGINPGDAVSIDMICEGYILIRKMVPIKLSKEGFDNLIKILDYENLIIYEWKDDLMVINKIGNTFVHLECSWQEGIDKLYGAIIESNKVIIKEE